MSVETQEIIDLEIKFWESMKAKNADAASSLIADSSLAVGPMGTIRMDPATYKKMTEEGDWTLESYELEDVVVVFPGKDTAAIAYKVHQMGVMKGQPMDMHCADSTVWVRDRGDWKVALHSETVLQPAKLPEPA